MTARGTSLKPVKAFRIGGPGGRCPIWRDGGARISPGRWHEAGASVIHASEHYSTAMLEAPVRCDAGMPSDQHFIRITISAGISYETVNVDLIEGWSAPSEKAARRFGRDWYRQARSAVLFVPSVVAWMERDMAINAGHTDFPRITTGIETPI